MTSLLLRRRWTLEEKAPFFFPFRFRFLFVFLVLSFFSFTAFVKK